MDIQTQQPETKLAKLSVVAIKYEKYLGQEKVVAENLEEKTIEIQGFLGPTVNVNVALGVTINMGNFSSLRIDVGLSLPAYLEQVQEAYQIANKFVHDRITEERNKLVKK